MFTFAKLSSIQDPPNSAATGDTLVGESGPLYASSERKLPPNGKSLNIQVNGQQYIWRYTYPGGSNPDGLDDPYSYEQMVVPTEHHRHARHRRPGRRALMVDPAARRQVPGRARATTTTPGSRIHKPGVYKGQCAALCGRGHARMIAVVRAVAPAQFDAWLATQKQLIAQADKNAQAARAKLGSQTGPGQVENP